MKTLNKKQVDHLLNNYAEIWMMNDTEIQYLASIKEEKHKNNYYIEKGVLKNGIIKPNVFRVPKNILDNIKISTVDKVNKRFVKSVTNNELKIVKEYVEEILPQNINDHKIRPYLAGCKVRRNSSDLEVGGTLGAIIMLKSFKNSLFIISNYHILSTKQNLILDEIIFQPSKIYGKFNSYELDYSNAIAHLKFGRYGDTKRKDGTNGNTLDVAFAEVLNNNMSCAGFTSSKKTLELKKSILKNIETPLDEMVVHINGKTSGKQKGTIKSTNAFVRVRHSYKRGKSIIFKNQLLIKKGISKGGDSGSVVINDNNNVVGLIHAGDGKNVSIANNINHIFNHIYKIKAAPDQKIVFKQFLT
ncbi:hypothetical protein H2O64_18325 [Kordia sp. YSTF-M3]|uniref:Serine protease n=1 Tax=Kordia aestuariivivens TaxID=2759037 RepID=A0ABR7QDL9_9FLAO|nr:hypothetical protein [Kordia aestuariivivens]MBC8756635.1 hypothetical protein [Kordia aestuariivivens]